MEATDRESLPIDSLIVELVRQACKKLFKNNNVADLELLHKEAGQLIVKYQPMIKHLVYKQASKGEPIDADFQADLIANIQAKLLQKATSGKLAAQYKGNALFSTYLYKVAYHTMIDEWRKYNRNRAKALATDSDVNSIQANEMKTAASNLTYTELIEQHVKRLQTLLQMQSSMRRKRFEFSLQIVYRIQLIAEDIKRLYPDSSDHLLVEILSYFGKHYHEIPQSQLFVLAVDFLTELEQNNTPINSESFRIWFQNVLRKVKQTLFKNLPTEDKKTLDTYFEFLVYKFYGKN